MKISLTKILNEIKEKQPFAEGFTEKEAARAAKALGVNFSIEEFDIAAFTRGMNVEREHADVSKAANVIGKIALAHLREDPAYYIKLATIEA